MGEEYISIRTIDLQKIASGEINLTEYLLGLVAREQETNRLLTKRIDSLVTASIARQERD